MTPLQETARRTGRVDDAVYACPREAHRGGCRFGPRDNRVGWTDEDLDRMWYVQPTDYPVKIMGISLSVEVVPCPEHEAELLRVYGDGS